MGAEPVSLEPIEEIALEETVSLEPTITEEREFEEDAILVRLDVGEAPEELEEIEFEIEEL